jgi:uncharacterized damage-inducible protein DinB
MRVGGMTMNADYYRLLFDYGWWARDKLFEAAEKLSDEAWKHPNGFTYWHIAGILQHAMQGEIRSAMRFQGLPVTGSMPSVADAPDRAELLSLWQQEEAKLRRWLASLKDADLDKMITTYNGEVMLWKSMSHVTYHSMQHRSEAAEALTMAGSSPGDIDLMVYLMQPK